MLRSQLSTVNVDKIQAGIFSTVFATLVTLEQGDLLVYDKHIDASGTVTNDSNGLDLMSLNGLLLLFGIELLAAALGCLSRLALRVTIVIGADFGRDAQRDNLYGDSNSHPWLELADCHLIGVLLRSGKI